MPREALCAHHIRTDVNSVPQNVNSSTHCSLRADSAEREASRVPKARAVHFAARENEMRERQDLSLSFEVVAARRENKETTTLTHCRCLARNSHAKRRRRAGKFATRKD
jgi:hypothetical protein